MNRKVVAVAIAVVMGFLCRSREVTAAEPHGYAIVVSEATIASPGWRKVVTTLEEKHRAKNPVITTWRQSPEEIVAEMADLMPFYVCFVARPEEAGREFVAVVHRLMRVLDADPFTDAQWGILTGLNATNACAIAQWAEPLTVKSVTSGTELAMDRVEEGEWYSELKRGHMVRKRLGGKAEAVVGPDDTTEAIAERLSSGATDLFVTSGHATERDWQIGYSYRNGHFASENGKLWGVDSSGKRFPINSGNPKIWLAVGNCLAGHIDGPDSLALAFMNSGGVHQLVGYTVPTWYGFAGWGLLDYFVEQPGRFTLSEAFHANDNALIHRLTSDVSEHDKKGLSFDRDATALYGDPAWEVRMAKGKLQFDQSLEENNGVFTLIITPRDGERSYLPVNTNGSQRGGRPIIQFFPRRLADIEVVMGQEQRPVITDTFILVPLPPGERHGCVKIQFRARPATLNR